MKNKKIYYIASILSIFILVLNFFNAKSLHESLSKQEVLNTSSARLVMGILKLRENEIVFDNTFINSITRKKLMGHHPIVWDLIWFVQETLIPGTNLFMLI